MERWESTEFPQHGVSFIPIHTMVLMFTFAGRRYRILLCGEEEEVSRDKFRILHLGELFLVYLPELWSIPVWGEGICFAREWLSYDLITLSRYLFWIFQLFWSQQGNFWKRKSNSAVIIKLPCRIETKLDWFRTNVISRVSWNSW